jgi:hypothetical protein
MLKVKCVAMLISVLLAIAGCAEQGPELRTLTPPAPTVTPSITEHFLIGQVGEKYFLEHYTLVTEEAVGPDLVKASYRYTYEPYVKDYRFTLLFDLKKQQLSDEEVSVVLLEPQAFKISPEEAIKMAVAQGIEPTAKSYAVELIFGQMTNNRFAWAVTNPEANVGKIYKIVLDVEGGEVYVREVLGVDRAH